MAIPGEKAIQMVRTAHTQAAQLDIAVTAVVVDQSGRMIAAGLFYSQSRRSAPRVVHGARRAAVSVEDPGEKSLSQATRLEPPGKIAGLARGTELNAKRHRIR